MKQDTSWMKHLSKRLQKKKDRRCDVFGNPLPTAYEAIHFPKAVQAWLESRKPFQRLHESAKACCNVCIQQNVKCDYPTCTPAPF